MVTETEASSTRDSARTLAVVSALADRGLRPSVKDVIVPIRGLS